ncbi:hypothetical protein X769_23890 [Mesorhizobium sp. LSJC268A00]|uniref:hypothetical protein n=1 Tax=unclassified Mesorhizobium TaxID=325217 RepID=UPI0003CDF792|nr:MULTISPECIES: hypothetical protein [unclassified Mesorhizobium]ESW99286.1 hypothetical protein X769_23890 [Mesorhizobium sp. LSJC268A00]ESZ12880.1 hypothetical protein X735_20580 [Mesorhizobium sp. L2C085B000]
MVHIIPLSVGRRRKASGNEQQYPAGPQAGAVQPLDEYWQAVADRYEQRLAQQNAFDTEIATRALDGELAKAEADAVANASADGAGLHDGMYGQVDPHTGRVLQTGRFDTLFDNFVKQAPAEIRPDLASRKTTLREAGALRMAQQQLDRRRQYEQDQLAGVQAAGLNTIKLSDPNDQPTFDAARRTGLDLISKMYLDPQARLRAEASWRESTAKARMETLIVQDPRRALDMLSAALGQRGKAPPAAQQTSGENGGQE